MGKICSSEEGGFRRADEAFGYLQHSFSPDCYEKSFMVEMGLRKQSPLLSGSVPTVQSQQQIRLERCFGQDGSATRTCLQENPSTNEEVADRQCIEISYTKGTEK